MSLCYESEKWLMITFASVAITITVGLVLMQYAHGYVDGNNNGKDDVKETNPNLKNWDDLHPGQTVDNQTTVDTAEFSISVPDNWAHTRGLSSHVGLTPSEFGEILVNAFEGVNEELKYGGAYAEFRDAWYYPIQNAPFDAFVKYDLDRNFHGFNITSKQNVTIDNEPAVKIYADGFAQYVGDYLITDYTGIKSVLYLAWHDEKPYRIQYTASVKDFEKYLPQFEQMVKSFKFVRQE